MARNRTIEETVVGTNILTHVGSRTTVTTPLGQLLAEIVLQKNVTTKKHALKSTLLHRVACQRMPLKKKQSLKHIRGHTYYAK